METFCFIIALQIVIGLYIIPVFSLTRIYYYFVPSFIHAYITDKFEVINELNRTRFLMLSILLCCSFFFGISSTKIILSFDNSQFSLLTAIQIQFLTIVLLFVQIFICFSIEKKIPNNIFDFIKQVKDRNKKVDFIFNLVKIKQYKNLYRINYFKCKYNIELYTLNRFEIIDKVALFKDLFNSYLDEKCFCDFIKGKEINRKIDLNVKLKNEAYNLFNEFFILYSKDESNKVTISQININHINFFNDNFTLNGVINPFHINDKRSIK